MERQGCLILRGVALGYVGSPFTGCNSRATLIPFLLFSPSLFLTFHIFFSITFPRVLAMIPLFSKFTSCKPVLRREMEDPRFLHRQEESHRKCPSIWVTLVFLAVAPFPRFSSSQRVDRESDW